MLTIGEHSNCDKITELVLKARKYNDKKTLLEYAQSLMKGEMKKGF